MNLKILEFQNNYDYVNQCTYETVVKPTQMKQLSTLTIDETVVNFKYRLNSNQTYEQMKE